MTAPVLSSERGDGVGWEASSLSSLKCCWGRLPTPCLWVTVWVLSTQQPGFGG